MRWIWLVVVLALCCAALARAQTPESQPAEADQAPAAETTAPTETTEATEATEAEEEKPLEPPFDILHNERLTGDWWGGRRWLEDRGVQIDLNFWTIYQQNVHGGVQTRHGHRVSGSYDLELTLDTEAMKLWNGGTIYALAQGGWDDGISRDGKVGDLFDVNGFLVGTQAIQLTELWYEQALLDKKLRIKFGKIDLTTDFDTNAFANDETAQFLNLALAYSRNIPFPWQGHGIQFVATPTEWFYFGAGIADAEANPRTTGFESAYHRDANTFSIHEFGLTPLFETGWGKLPGNYRFGLWYDPQPKEKFFNDLGGRLSSVPLKRDDVGFYTSMDQVVFRENPLVEGDEQGLGLFFRYAYAHGDVNEIEDFWSVGGQYQGLIPTRDKDVLGFGVAQGVLSRELRTAGRDPHRETALELYYNIQVFPWLHLSPDFQWILCPGGENGRDAFVAGVRLQVTF